MSMLHQGSHTDARCPMPDGCEATRELGVQFYPADHAVQTISAGDGKCQRVLAGLAPMDRAWHQMTTVIDRLVLHQMQTYIDGELATSIRDDYRSFNRSSEELRLAWVEESRYRHPEKPRPVGLRVRRIAGVSRRRCVRAVSGQGALISCAGGQPIVNGPAPARQLELPAKPQLLERPGVRGEALPVRCHLYRNVRRHVAIDLDSPMRRQAAAQEAAMATRGAAIL
jgi:hypothetical protein